MLTVNVGSYVIAHPISNRRSKASWETMDISANAELDVHAGYLFGKPVQQGKVRIVREVNRLPAAGATAGEALSSAATRQTDPQGEPQRTWPHTHLRQEPACTSLLRDNRSSSTI